MKTRRIISFLLALVLVTALLPTAAFAADAESDWHYSISDNKATVTHYNGAGGDVEIPATLGGCPVTGIGDFAFNCCYDLTSVTIPSCVESIGDDAFAFCYALTSVTIPSGVTGIGDGAFSYCYVLKDLRFLGSRAQFYAIPKGEAWDFCMGGNVGGCTIHFNTVPTEVSTWEDLQAALSAGGDIILTSNVTPDNPYWADALVINSGVLAALDLNGHTVDRGYTEQGFDGSVIKIYGTLTVTDSASGGAITGGFPDQFGGGVQILGGTFNLLGGSITGNSVGKTGFFGTEGLGGGVYLQSGTFNMSGGSISGNKALGSSMGNSLGRGGGVYISGGTFHFTGGEISGNDAGAIGGGVYLASTYSGHDGIINVSGNAAVKDNTVSGAVSNVYLEEGGVLTVAGELNRQLIGVTMQTPGVFTSGWKDKMGETADPAEYFTSDNADLAVFLTDAGEAQIGVEEYPLWVGGVQVTSANKGDVLGDGTASFDPDSNTLTLTNANITATSSNQYNGGFTYNDVVYAYGLALTVSLSGNNTVGDGSADSAISSDKGSLTITGGSLTAAGSATALYAKNGISITGSTVIAEGGTSHSDGIFADGAVTITDSTVTATGDRYGIVATLDAITISGADSVVTASGGTMALRATNSGVVTLNDGLAYIEGEATAKKAVISKPTTHTVTVTPGANMMIAAGANEQTVRAGDEMERVVYLASEGYYFPEDYAVASVNGVTVTWDSFTRITVFGTPTADASITLPDPTAKAKEQTPTATFTATGPDTGALTGVTAGMTYAIDGGAAIAITGERIDLTGLAPCTITVIQPGNGTTTIDSDAQIITVTKAETPSLTATQPSIIGGTGSIPTTAEHELSTDGAAWTACTGETTGLVPDTYYVRVKAAGTVLASDAQEIVIISPGSVAFSGRVTLNGRPLTSGDLFTFEVYKDGNVIATAQSDAAGNIDFTEINYFFSDVGQHTYTVKQSATTLPGVAIDGREYTVDVIVSYNPGDAALTVTPSDNFTGLYFTNTYDKQTPPEYAVPTGLEAIYGQTLADVTLPDGWAWDDALTTKVGNVGDNTFSATYTPDDTTLYKAVTAALTITVSQATPDCAPPDGLTAIYGQTLADVTLTDGWAWDDALTTSVGNVGDNTFSATFTPEDTLNYKTVTTALTITVSQATPDCAPPDGLTAIYGQTLADVTLTDGWAWDDALTTSVGNVGDNTFSASFTPEDTENYSVVTVPLTVSVTKAGTPSSDLTEDEKPKVVENLIEDVFEQALVTAPEKLPEGYTGIEYSTDGENWSGTLPTGKIAGEYTVQIKYIGDANHEDFTGDPVAVTIVKAVYAFTNGEGELTYTKGSGKELTATVVLTGAEDTSFEHFAGVYIGEAELQRDVDYAVKKGSTVVTILPAALDKLDVGNHTLTVRFTNGEASAQFTVLAANSGDPVPPQTGDNSHIGIWIILMTVSAIAATSLIVTGKRKRIFGK